MMFALLHWIATSVLFDVGLLYAVFVALLPSLGETTGDVDATRSKNAINLPISSLKLWLILTFLASLSYVGMDCLPLFLEARVMFTWFLLTVPPASHAKVYDNTFEPLLGCAGRAITALESNRLITRRVGLKMARGCVELAVLIMKHVARCGVLDGDEIHNVMGGLAFTRRALRYAEAMQRGGVPSSVSCSHHRLMESDK